ncbi:MAG: WYL domain-containing protein [Clostridiales bacterium]|jgi:predicted DNA-binding transcriptional regulator YafY|nr:WYL domain-containing protein [Clostridiales bacterium]
MERENLDDSRKRLLILYEILESIAAGAGEITLRTLNERLNKVTLLGDFDRRTIYRDLFLINRITNLNALYDKSLRAYKVTFKEKLTRAELKIVVNAILSARYDSVKESEALAKKLYSLGGGKEKKFSDAHTVEGRIKLGGGMDTLDKLEYIHQAMESNRKILFDYRKYTLNKQFEVVRDGCLVSPYKVLWQNDKLYLVGSFDSKSFSHYRIERICNLRQSNELRTPLRDIMGHGRPFNEAEYLARAIELSRGELTRVEVRFDRGCISAVFDSLGKNVFIRDNADGTFTLDENVMLNKKFVRWILGFGAQAKVIGPEKLREEIAENIKKAGEYYLPVH